MAVKSFSKNDLKTLLQSNLYITLASGRMPGKVFGLNTTLCLSNFYSLSWGEGRWVPRLALFYLTILESIKLQAMDDPLQRATLLLHALSYYKANSEWFAMPVTCIYKLILYVLILMHLGTVDSWYVFDEYGQPYFRFVPGVDGHAEDDLSQNWNCFFVVCFCVYLA